MEVLIKKGFAFGGMQGAAGPRGAAPHFVFDQGPPPSYSIKEEFAFGGMQRGRVRLLACLFLWDHGGRPHFILIKKDLPQAVLIKKGFAFCGMQGRPLWS